MLTYTFSKREKVLLAVLAVILVIVAWYVLVYQNVNNQITSLNSQIADVQTQTTTDTAKVAQMNTMQRAIDDNKAKGVKPSVLPAYDNVQPLMASLNTILAGTNNYQMKFDNLDWSQGNVVQRGVTITFGCNDYASAKNVVTSLEKGAYPCNVDTVSITDNTATKTASTYSNVGSGSSSASAGSNFGATVHATFFEKAA